jgi:hypothetical protein
MSRIVATPFGPKCREAGKYADVPSRELASHAWMFEQKF